VSDHLLCLYTGRLIDCKALAQFQRRQSPPMMKHLISAAHFDLRPVSLDDGDTVFYYSNDAE